MTAVLRAYVGTDTIGLRGIVYLEEQTTEFLIGYLVGIKLYPYRLNMTCAVCLHIYICGVLFRASDVAYRCGQDS